MILSPTVLEIYSSEAVVCGIFECLLNFDGCQPKVFCDVISGVVDQDVRMDLFANLGESRLRLSEASFSAVFRTSIPSDLK